MKIVENLWTVGAEPQTPLRELTALPQTPVAGGEGACYTLPKNPPPLSAFGSLASIFGPSVFPPPPPRNEKSLFY